MGRGGYITISPSERQVMKVLWSADRSMAATEVAERLVGTESWSLTTVRTFLNRLAKKGALHVERHKGPGEGVNYYTPCLAESESLVAEGKSCLDRYFGGDLCGFVAQFVETDAISEEELRALHDLIERKMKGPAK